MSRAEERLWERAQNYLAQQQSTAARIALESLVQRVPEHTAAHLQLGAIAYTDDRLRDTARHAMDAARMLPDALDADGLCKLILTLLQVGEVVAARRCFDHPAVALCRSGPALARLASARQMIGDHEQALVLLDRARDAGLGADPDFRYVRSIQLVFNGKLDEAKKELETCLALGATFGRASVTLARLEKQTRENNHLPFIRSQLQRVARRTEDHAAFEFALYKELEDIGDYDDAWQALERGSALMAARLEFDAPQEQRLVDALIDVCTPDFLAQAAAAQEGPQPIFVIGMPRSGTTVLDRILGNHSQIVSAGELGDFGRAMRWVADHKSQLPIDEVLLERVPKLDFAEVGRRYLEQTQWRAQGRRYFVDKLPINWIQAGFIRRALPRAKILHMSRDAMDVCFSNFRAFFGVGYAYSYDLRWLAEHYRNYRRTLAHWQRAMPGGVLDIAYADLVADPEAQARRILDYCELPHEEGCTDLERNTAPVATLSSMQVRGAIHRHAIAEWRRYERQLAPLQAALA